MDEGEAYARLQCRGGQLFRAFHQYKNYVGSYPTGSSTEIAKALLEGNNPKKIIILAVKKAELNAKGEIVDPWGTPLKIYFANNEVLIRWAARTSSSTTANPASSTIITVRTRRNFRRFPMKDASTLPQTFRSRDRSGARTISGPMLLAAHWARQAEGAVRIRITVVNKNLPPRPFPLESRYRTE